jgi:hypothetical protein
MLEINFVSRVVERERVRRDFMADFVKIFKGVRL